MPVDEVILLVGGLGTRLRGVVADVPKPLAPVAGRPFLAWVLDQLAQEGIRRVILATGYMASTIEHAIGSRWHGMAVEYSVEQQPLGTGGALRMAMPLLAGNGAHVVNGDTFLRYSPRMLEEATRRQGAPVGIALARVADAGRYGAVEADAGRVTAFREKGKEGAGDINAGCYFFTEKALQGLPLQGRFSLEHDVLQPLAASGGIAAYTQTTDFVDIGVPEDYLWAQQHFATSRR